MEKDIASNSAEIWYAVGIGVANWSKASKTKKRF